MTWKRVVRILRNKLVGGLVILIPIIITVRGLWWLFTYVDELAQPLAVRLIGRTVPGLGLVTTLAIVFLAGLLFSTGPLKRVLEGIEDVVDGVPVVGVVYGTTKKVLAGLGGSGSGSAFQRFVFAQLPGRYPGRGRALLSRARDPAAQPVLGAHA